MCGPDTYLTTVEQCILQITGKDKVISQLPVVFDINQEDRDMLEVRLMQIREKLLDDGKGTVMLMQPDITTGFTTDLISSVVNDAEHIASLQILMDYFPFFNPDHACKVYECIQELLSSNVICTSDDSSDDCIIDLPPSDTDCSDDAWSDSDNWDEYTKPVLRDSDSE